MNKALGLQGNTIGNVTVNDFASVLGVGNNSISGDLNNVPDGFKVYNQNSSQVISAMTHKPNGMSGGEMQLINLVFGGYGTQILFDSSGDGIWIRTKHSSIGWNEWHLIAYQS